MPNTAAIVPAAINPDHTTWTVSRHPAFIIIEPDPPTLPKPVSKQSYAAPSSPVLPFNRRPFHLPIRPPHVSPYTNLQDLWNGLQR
ncbi:MAG: hypothetical protein OWS74_00275 [Firmicutes bacterium]|nr:hypothetical protein [Bacillota bacterium]